jgi:Sec-independent protein secretion pathway component TatC
MAANTSTSSGMILFNPSDPIFYVSLSISLLMGYLVPLPYNYYQLKRYGKSCH